MIPLEIKWEDKAINFKTFEKELSNVHPQTDLVILPETFSTGFPSGEDKEHVRILSEKNSGKTIGMLRNLSKKYNVAITGSFIADTGGLLSNRAFFLEPSGDEYFSDKRHLFSMAGEDKLFSPGDYRMTVRYRGWNIAVIICYDLRFPIWCRNVRNGYDLLIAVANWPASRIDAWHKLLYARAIENQSYVCGVNCKGSDKKGFNYNGCATAIDYKGKDITVSINDSDIRYATLRQDDLNAFRDKFPAWRDADNFNLL
ncbi:MAG: nitrilase family protein [Muribaculaceae bacterium]|nr:nitrilase family protein [Muribaculaceae bacterium]